MVIAGVAAKKASQLAALRAAPRPSAASTPPCPTRTHAELVAQNLGPLRTFAFDGVEYSRRVGSASCVMTATRRYVGGKRSTVCQFTSPESLEIRTSRGLYGFAPGPGVPATITIVGDVPTCVAKADFTIPKLLEAARKSRGEVSSPW